MKQGAVVLDVDIGPAEFPMVGGFDGAPKLMAQQLLTVTNPQHGHAQLEHHGRGNRRRHRRWEWSAWPISSLRAGANRTDGYQRLPTAVRARPNGLVVGRLKAFQRPLGLLTARDDLAVDDSAGASGPTAARLIQGHRELIAYR